MDLIVGRLLSQLHAMFSIPVCPGGMAWATTLAGGVVALLPMIGAILAALSRRLTGNQYGAGPIVLFGAVGMVFTALLPWLVFDRATTVFRAALGGRTVGIGLTGADVASLNQSYCFDIVEGDYLGGSRSVSDVLGGVADVGPAVFVGAVGLLAVLPLICWLFVFAQARIAFRRGPKWPARLLWLPMLALILATASQNATVTAHLWLGFLPVAVLGMIGVAVVGAPSWNTIERRATAAGAAASAGSGGRSRQATSSGGSPAGSQRQDQPYPAQPPGLGPAQPHGPVHGPAHGAAGSGRQPVGRPMSQPHRPPTAPLGPLGPVPPYQPSGPQPQRALAADPGPLPETLQRAMGLAAAASGPATRIEPPTLPPSRFRRVRPLGSGGFGTVWLAVDTALDRTVAVKAAKAPDAETERRIRREARALAAVHHPNCVRIYDILTDADGELVIIMEYVPGRSLSAEIDAAGRLPDAAAARMWSTLAGALHAAHLKGVLHRDVKPSNIIIDEGGYPHLIDFGIARSTGDITLTAAGMVLGTPDYMAPEVAAGKPAGPAADAWQLAATVSYALSGLPPRGHRDGSIAAMLAAAQGEPCNQLPAGSAHRGLLERALHPDPARRPSLLAVQAELDHWLDGIGQRPDGPVTQRFSPAGPQPMPPSTPPRPARPVQPPPPGAPAWPTEDPS